jgi:lysophospholipase L1-like esterase
VRKIALAHSAKVIDLNGDIAPNGTIEPRYAIDGVHFTNAAYAIWASKIVTASRQ